MDMAVDRGMEAEAERIYSQYHALLSTVVRGILGDGAEDWEACVQDVIWEFLRAPGKFDPARGNEKTYLCVLARSRARTLRARRGGVREEPLEDYELILCAQDGAERAAVQDGLHRALAGLSAEERRLFTLRFLYEWPPAEIGRSLHLSRAAVDKRVSRLRGKLKKLLALQGITVDGKE